MGALPKNKITSAERGKRRAGNTPTITKDTKVIKVPLHKRGLVQTMMASLGFVKAEKTEESHKKSTKVAPQAEAGVKPEVSARPTVAPKAVPQKSVKRTQHKG